MVPICILFALLTGASRSPRSVGYRCMMPRSSRSTSPPAIWPRAARPSRQGPLEPYLSITGQVRGACSAPRRWAMAIAAARRWPAVGVGVALAAMIAFLPIAGEE